MPLSTKTVVYSGDGNPLPRTLRRNHSILKTKSPPHRLPWHLWCLAWLSAPLGRVASRPAISLLKNGGGEERPAIKGDTASAFSRREMRGSDNPLLPNLLPSSSSLTNAFASPLPSVFPSSFSIPVLPPGRSSFPKTRIFSVGALSWKGVVPPPPLSALLIYHYYRPPSLPPKPATYQQSNTPAITPAVHSST